MQNRKKIRVLREIVDTAGPTLSIKTYFLLFLRVFFCFSMFLSFTVFPEIQKRDNKNCPDGKSFLMHMFVICTYIYIWMYIYIYT